MSPVREAGFDQVNPVPVGVSLLTKAACRRLDVWRMHRPLREQARSHRSGVGRYIFGVARFDEREFARQSVSSVTDKLSDAIHA